VSYILNTSGDILLLLSIKQDVFEDIWYFVEIVMRM